MWQIGWARSCPSHPPCQRQPDRLSYELVINSMLIAASPPRVRAKAFYEPSAWRDQPARSHVR